MYLMVRLLVQSGVSKSLASDENQGCDAIRAAGMKSPKSDMTVAVRGMIAIIVHVPD